MLVSSGAGLAQVQPPPTNGGEAIAGKATTGGGKAASGGNTKAELLARGKTPKAQQVRTFLDGVMMTIDNEVILFSEVEDAVDSRIKARAQGDGKPVSPREQRRIYNDTRNQARKNAIRARATLSMPGLRTEQIHDYVQSILRNQEQEQIEAYGSLSRMRDELAEVGQSKFMMERKQREKILRDLSRQELGIRLRDRLALMITPQMLREHFLKARKENPTSTVSDLGLVFFSTATTPLAEAQKKATAAAAAWRSGEASSKAIAEQFGGRAFSDRTGLTAHSGSSLREFILDFIGKSQGGTVSAPIHQQAGLWVLKILRQQAAREFRFDDPKIQAQLRQELLQIAFRRIEFRAAYRDRQ